MLISRSLILLFFWILSLIRAYHTWESPISLYLLLGYLHSRFLTTTTKKNYQHIGPGRRRKQSGSCPMLNFKGHAYITRARAPGSKSKPLQRRKAASPNQVQLGKKDPHYSLPTQNRYIPFPDFDQKPWAPNPPQKQTLPFLSLTQGRARMLVLIPERQGWGRSQIWAVHVGGGWAWGRGVQELCRLLALRASGDCTRLHSFSLPRTLGAQPRKVPHNCRAAASRGAWRQSAHCSSSGTGRRSTVPWHGPLVARVAAAGSAHLAGRSHRGGIAPPGRVPALLAHQVSLPVAWNHCPMPRPRLRSGRPPLAPARFCQGRPALFLQAHNRATLQGVCGGSRAPTKASFCLCRCYTDRFNWIKQNSVCGLYWNLLAVCTTCIKYILGAFWWLHVLDPDREGMSFFHFFFL